MAPAAQTRFCPVCGGSRPLADFPTRGRHCRVCHRKYVNDHYQRNRQHYVDKARRRRVRVVAEVRQWLYDAGA